MENENTNREVPPFTVIEGGLKDSLEPIQNSKSEQPHDSKGFSGWIRKVLATMNKNQTDLKKQQGGF